MEAIVSETDRLRSKYDHTDMSVRCQSQRRLVALLSNIDQYTAFDLRSVGKRLHCHCTFELLVLHGVFLVEA